MDVVKELIPRNHSEQKMQKDQKPHVCVSCVMLNSSTETIGSVLLPFSHSGAASGSPDTIVLEPGKTMDTMDPNPHNPPVNSLKYVMLHHIYNITCSIM